jgi:hypothetical protein
MHLRLFFGPWMALSISFGSLGCDGSGDGQAQGSSHIEGAFRVESRDARWLDVEATAQFDASADLARQSPPDGRSFVRNSLHGGLIDAASRHTLEAILAEPSILEEQAASYVENVTRDLITSIEVQVNEARDAGHGEVEGDAATQDPVVDPPAGGSCSAGPPDVVAPVLEGFGSFDMLDENGGILELPDQTTLVVPACAVIEAAGVQTLHYGSSPHVSLPEPGAMRCLVAETRPQRAVVHGFVARYTWQAVQDPELYEAWFWDLSGVWSRATTEIEGADITIQVPYSADLAFCLRR